MSEKLNIAFIQANLSWEDAEANRKMFSEKIEKISNNVELIILPEMFTTGFSMNAENLAEETEALAEQLVNIPMGGSLGAAYGYGKKERYGLKPMDGIVFGATTWASTHETSLPILGLEPKPTEVPMRMQMNELFAHVAFGVVTEVVRHYVDKLIRENN